MLKVEEIDGHPTEETRVFHHRDLLLRRHGYAIASSPKSGPVLWLAPDGETLTEEEALRRVWARQHEAKRRKKQQETT